MRWHLKNSGENGMSDLLWRNEGIRLRLLLAAK